jgi:hypothetical protein
MKSLLVALLLLVSSIELYAQPIVRPYPFDMHPLDTSLTEVFDQMRGEVLPIAPAGKLKLDSEGHLVDQSGQRVRLFGTSLWFNAQFLNSHDAKALAGRLRKLGFNAVRFVYNDLFGWEEASFFKVYNPYPDVSPSSYAVSPLQLARFDTLLYELKQNGIYAILNLNTAHGYSYGENVWQWDSTYSNAPLHQLWDTQAQDLQKAWAKTLLTHVNPLTGLALNKDPMIAYVSLNYEQSLHFFWRLNRLNYINEDNVLNKGTQTITYHQSKRLDSLFNRYLEKKYKTNQALIAAWGGSSTVDGRNLVDNGSFEKFNSAAWALNVGSGVQAGKSEADGGVDSSTFVKLRIMQLGLTSEPGGIVFYNSTARCDKDSLYELSFWAKLGYSTQRPDQFTRGLYVAVIPYANTGIASVNELVQLDTSWKKYSYTFRCDASGLQYIYLQMGHQMGDVWLDAFEIKRKAETPLLPGEALSAQNIIRLRIDQLPAAPLPRAAEMLMFYDSLERGWFKSLEASLRQNGYEGLVNWTQTQWWALLPDIYKASGGQVTEYHTGWDYMSSRPNQPYTDSTWVIRNYSMVKSTYGGTFGEISANAVAKKAFILGDHSTPWMNQSLSEHFVLLPALASYQDWDGIFYTPFAVFNTDLTATRLPNQFTNEGGFPSIAKNPAALTLLPFASNTFLNGRIKRNEVADSIVHTMNEVWLSPTFSDYRGMSGVEGYLETNAATAFRMRQSFGGNVHKVAAEYPYLPDTSIKRFEGNEIVWDQTNGLFTVSSPHVNAATGYFGSNEFILSQLTFRRTDNAKDILSMYLMPLDSSTLATSRSKMLAITTRAQNTGLTWAADSLSFGKNFGSGPTIMSAATMIMRLKSEYSELRVQPLDERGEPLGDPLMATKSPKEDYFVFTIDQSQTKTPWYRLTEVGAIRDVIESDIADVAMHLYPNPSSDRVTVISRSIITSLKIIDVLGREVADLDGGELRVTLDVSSLSAGHYSVVVSIGEMKKVLPLRVQ